MSSTGKGSGPLVRVAAIGAGAVVLSAAAIGGGLWLAAGGPDVPESGDVHTAAPECGSVPGEAVAEVLPDAAPETDERGPLAGGQNAMCAWTSAGLSEDAPGLLRVVLSAYFTDASGDTPVTGDERAQAALTALVPVRGEEVALPSGAEGFVWEGQTAGAAELAYPTDNLLVRVTYSGADGDDPLDSGDARDLTVRFAEHLGEAL